MRSAVETSLPGTAIIQTRTYVTDSGGGGTTAWTATGTVACRLSPISATGFGSERGIAMRIAEDANWLLTLPQTTTIDTDCRVTTQGNTYEVLALHEPRDWDLCRRAEVNEVV